MSNNEPQIFYVPNGTIAVSVPVHDQHGNIVDFEHIRMHPFIPGMPWVGKSERSDQAVWMHEPTEEQTRQMEGELEAEMPEQPSGIRLAIGTPLIKLAAKILGIEVHEH